MEQLPPQPALRYEAEVGKDGHVELSVPFTAGERLIVLVIPQLHDGKDGLLEASLTSLGFWDNPYDDEDWNVA